MVRKKMIVRKKEKKRMAREAKLIFSGIGVIALLLAGIIAVIAFDTEDVKEKIVEEIVEPEKHPNLFIDEVRFVNSATNRRSDSEEHTVEATVYFTNSGEGTSKNVELEVYAMVTKSNMGEDSASVNVGDIASMKTKKATFTMDLPKGNDYKIDLLVFEDGMITKKGYGTVKIEEEASDVSAQEFKTTESKINWNSTESDDDTGDNDHWYGGSGESTCDDSSGADSAVGIMVFVIVVILLFIIIISVVWHRKKKRALMMKEKYENTELVYEN